MTPDLTNLLLSLGSAIASTAGVTLGSDLFVNELPSGVGEGSPASVLRAYGGPPPGSLRRVPAVSVQCMTQAMVQADGLNQAMALYEALHYPADYIDVGLRGRPRSAWSIDAKAIDSNGDLVADSTVAGGAWETRYLVIAAPPGVVGRDDSGRFEIPFSFDLHFTQPTAA